MRTGLEVVPERIRLDVLAALAPRPPPAVPRLGPRLAPDVPRPPSEPPHDAVDLVPPLDELVRLVAVPHAVKRLPARLVRRPGALLVLPQAQHLAVDLAQPLSRIEKAIAQVERELRGREVVRVEGGEASREGADGADAGREGVEGGVGGGEL